MTTNNVLLVLLGEPLSLYSAAVRPASGFALESETFVSLLDYEMVSFYDWLRSESGSVVGVRVSPIQEYDSIFEDILRPQNRPSYVDSSSTSPVFEVFFTADRSYIDEDSADQDFGDNQVYRGDRGTFAISFGTRAIQLGSIAAPVKPVSWK